ncbi:hypothetical protein N7510_007310 [Penicillium lagena]|uniref:uncharacterized protein n=1 Tax=Penicillium lagena TaxID=94218 RepID=UPI0025409ECE|nr:uncharacterized protein N7510_007310 [Penicillium lagena]KAJ5610591.1 hypothetical protein N7510_007310 [Penicillium lagena]
MLDHAIPHRPLQKAYHWSIPQRGLFSVPDAILPLLGVLLGQVGSWELYCALSETLIVYRGLLSDSYIMPPFSCSLSFFTSSLPLLPADSALSRVKSADKCEPMESWRDGAIAVARVGVELLILDSLHRVDPL